MAEKNKTLHGRLGTFGTVPLMLLQDKRIKPVALRVYIAISSFQGTDEQAYPSVMKIMERSGASRNSCIGAIKNLVETGWLERQRRPNKSSVYRCLTYYEPAEVFNSKQDGRRGNTPPKNERQVLLFEIPVVPKLATTKNPEVPNLATSGSTKSCDFPYKKRPLVKDHSYTLFLEWNKIPGLQHSKDELFQMYMKPKHKKLITAIGIKETRKAIHNYQIVQTGKEYYFNHRWNFWDFIARGLSKFIDDAKPLENFSNNSDTIIHKEDDWIVKAMEEIKQ